MKYDHLKKDLGCYILVLFPPIFKNIEIPTNDTDKNTVFTTKSVHIVTCGSFEIYIYDIKYLNVNFICLWYAHKAFNV